MEKPSEENKPKMDFLQECSRPAKNFSFYNGMFNADFDADEMSVFNIRPPIVESCLITINLDDSE